MLRVVRRPPSVADLREGATQIAGERRTSLKGGNREMLRRGPGSLHSYGDLTAGRRAVGGDLGRQADGEIAWKADEVMRGRTFLVTHPRRSDVTPGQGEAVRYRG